MAGDIDDSHPDRSYLNSHSADSVAETLGQTNDGNVDQQPESVFSVASVTTGSRVGSNSPRSAGTGNMDECMLEEQAHFSIPSSGFYVKRTEIIKTFRRVTVSEQYYNHGTLAFASRPTVQDREVDSKQDVQILPCQEGQFQEAKAKSVLAEEVSHDTHGVNATEPVVKEPSDADDVSFSGSVVPLKTKRRSARSRALLSEDEESPVKEESSSSKKSSRTTSGRKPIADTADLHFPSIGSNVLARYIDNVYYLATVVAKGGKAKAFEVRFSDTKEDRIVHEGLLLKPTDWLIPDRPVMVKVNRDTPTGDYEQAVIVEVITEVGTAARYRVKLEADGTEKTVDAADISLTEDQTLKYKFEGPITNGESKNETDSSKKSPKSTTEESSRTFSEGDTVYARWENSQRCYPGTILTAPSEVNTNYTVKYFQDNEVRDIPSHELILVDDLVRPGMDAEVERPLQAYGKVIVKEVIGSGEGLQATVEHRDTRQEQVHLSELTFGLKDVRRVLSGKPFPATPGAPASSKRTDLRASTRTASPAKKPESNVKAKPATKTPKAKKAPVSEQEVESVSVPGGEHEVDKNQVFRIGKEQFYKGEEVFAQWDTDHRWYAATIGGVRQGKYRIDWCENDQVNYVTPNEVIRAKEMLIKGVKINVIAENKNYYDEMVFESFSEDGNHLCQGKRNVVMPRRFTTMMIQEGEVKKWKAAQGAPNGSQNTPSSAQKAPSSSQKGRASEKQEGGAAPSGRKRQMSPTMEASPSARNGVKHAKKASTPELEEEEDTQPLKHCAFIVTSGAEKDSTFDREYQISQIDRMGGAVLTNFDELFSSGGKRFLVSPNACRTAKYLQCLAANIPCISHKYIMDLAENSKKAKAGFESYRLPAGKSSTAGNNQLVKWKSRKILLDNLRVGLVGGSGFQNTWLPAFKAGKAEAVLLEEKDVNKNGIPSLDVIVIEEEAPAKLIVLARQKHIPMVTVEWIIQTLIHGEKQDFDVWPFQDAAAAE